MSKVKLTKEIHSDGLWYFIRVDGKIIEARRDEQEAQQAFDKVVFNVRALHGQNPIETLKEVEI